jgi:exonuclease SbcC
MLKKISIKNFQVHAKKEVNLTKGINVIVGETNQGKSAIIRALYLLLENLPRGADKVFHREKSKLPMEISLEDDQGNVVTRKKKKYTLNGVVFKAFNNEVPKPIKEIFPLKPINWHKQLDSHFLVLNTPGAAAKSLGVSTGLEEQEVIIKEIKERLSTCKSETRRLQINRDEARDKIKKLRPVVACLMKARSVKLKEDELEQKQDKIHEIEDTLNTISKLNKRLRKTNIEPRIAITKQILDLIQSYEEAQRTQKILVDIVESLKDTSTADAKKLNSYIKEIDHILSLLPSLSKNETSRIALQQLLETYQGSTEIISSGSKEIKEKEKEFKALLKEVGVCDNCPIF